MLSRMGRISVLLLLLVSVFTLTGCDMSTTYEIDRANANIWDRFVLLLSDGMDWFAANLWGQYGLAILMVTIIVRLAILPLSIKQYKSMKRMQELQPEMNKLREKYKDDQKKQQEEMMKLFQENQVNPLGGCLPLLIQMPFISALYFAIIYNEAIKTHDFLWAQLGQIDPWILPLLAAATTAFQQLFMMAQNTNPQAQTQMRIMLIIFPVMIFIMARQFPAALPLYWVYSNIFTIIQNYFMYRDSSPATTELKKVG